MHTNIIPFAEKRLEKATKARIEAEQNLRLCCFNEARCSAEFLRSTEQITELEYRILIEGAYSLLSKPIITTEDK